MSQEAGIEHSLRTAPKSSLESLNKKSGFLNACTVAYGHSNVKHDEGLPCNRRAR
jgi:hypothetical protein